MSKTPNFFLGYNTKRCFLSVSEKKKLLNLNTSRRLLLGGSFYG